ncbi:hypothetical protein E4U54_006009 [Claviceps lovelessii]|nr:hypothetical protein E4U54_006009 [Claviceps lovelessii]
MKTTTVLGSLFLTALQASASPVDLAVRQPAADGSSGYCCITSHAPAGDDLAHFYLPRGIKSWTFPDGKCALSISSPDPKSCKGWEMEMLGSCNNYFYLLPIQVSGAEACNRR